MKKEDLNAINEIVNMKRSELIDELNSALREGYGNNRKNDFIQKDLTWEQWEELAPEMDFGGYRFETLFDDMAEDEWENDEKVQDLAWKMVDYAHYIIAVFIDPYDHDCVNVIYPNGFIEKDGGKDFKTCFYVVNV